jgi:uncharacterized protein (AIM24 family)
MAVPVQLTTNVQNETFGGVTYHIEGELVPALHLELSNTGVYFEHHILLWKDPAVVIALHPLKGAFKRQARIVKNPRVLTKKFIAGTKLKIIFPNRLAKLLTQRDDC